MTTAPHWTDDFRVVPGSKQKVFVYHRKGKCTWKFENKDENLRDMHEAAWAHYEECKEVNRPLVYDPDNVMSSKKTVEETYPEGPKPGNLYGFGTRGELRCWYDEKWREAHKISWDQNPQDTLMWLEGHGYRRIFVGAAIGTAPAVFFQRTPEDTVQMAVPGDVLVYVEHDPGKNYAVQEQTVRKDWVAVITMSSHV